MSEQDLTSSMQEMVAQMARMQAELDSLKARAQALPQPVSPPKVEVSTTRRRLLRQLAGGLVAGLAVAGIGITSPNDAEAKLSSNPTSNGLTGRVGMLVMPPGATVSGTMGGDTTKKVGLLVSGDTSFNIPAVVAPTVNSAIIGYTSGGGTAIAGLSQSGIGIYGFSDTNSAVWGKSTSSGNGIKGESSSGYGVYGISTSNHGVYGESSSIYAAGVNGTNTNSSGDGVFGYSVGGDGVVGSSDSGHGVFGSSPHGYAGYFQGAVHVTGTLEKPAGSFKIDHPLDPANRYLYHSFVESPDMMNIYNGIVTLDNQGEATVTMPDWFEALNSDFRYQLTCLGQYSQVYIAEEMKERKFKIAGGLPGQRVSWMVTGIRQDAYAKAHRIPVEEVKNDKEKGKYIHPELFGQPEEMSVHPRQVAAK